MAAQKTITVEQYRSAIRRPEIQVQTLIGLKLNKIRRRSTLIDTPAVRGMVNRIAHLVRIVEPQTDPTKPIKHVSLEASARAAKAKKAALKK